MRRVGSLTLLKEVVFENGAHEHRITLPQLTYLLSRCLFAAVLLSSLGWPAREVVAHYIDAPAILTSSKIDSRRGEYERKLEEYVRLRQRYDEEVKDYWDLIAEKRRKRNSKRRNSEEILVDDYVLTQPPVYVGPARPVDPIAPIEKVPPPTKKYVPVVGDFLNAAVAQFNFVPNRPKSELEFKRAYAKVAFAAGLTKEQVVRIYAFESGGNGKYDVQAGLEYPRPNAQAISTALGYNQLLATNSVELMAENGDHFVAVLRARAASLSGEARKAFERKIEVVLRMIEFGRSVPDIWSEHEKLATTPPGLGIHAMILDVDVGPLLQTQKLLNSISFAWNKGYRTPLTAAELELMNLTGDGTGLDMIMMQPEVRERVPTANFFQKSGYERNPVASRNNVVAKLLASINAKMDTESKLQGAMDLAGAFDHAK